jgi:hypothetical protein
MGISLVNQDAARIIGLIARCAAIPRSPRSSGTRCSPANARSSARSSPGRSPGGDLPATAGHELLAEIISALLLSR